jgi:hypothetical protein
VLLYTVSSCQSSCLSSLRHMFSNGQVSFQRRNCNIPLHLMEGLFATLMNLFWEIIFLGGKLTVIHFFFVPSFPCFYTCAIFNFLCMISKVTSTINTIHAFGPWWKREEKVRIVRIRNYKYGTDDLVFYATKNDLFVLYIHFFVRSLLPVLGAKWKSYK